MRLIDLKQIIITASQRQILKSQLDGSRQR